MSVQAGLGDGPVIILGAARSGTKFTRDVLAAANTELAVIPFDVNYIWRLGHEGHPNDELRADFVTDRTSAQIKRQLYKLAGIESAGDRVLLEKTVGNTLRVGFVDRVFPNARYVHLIRDGRAVTESSMRLWAAPPATKSLVTKLKSMPLSSYRYVAWFGINFLKGVISGRGGGQVWGPRYAGIMEDVGKRPLAEICARQWARCVDKALDELSDIDPERVFTLRYEDLVSNPEQIAKMARFAGIKDIEPVLAHHRGGVRKGNGDKWREGLTSTDLEQINKVIGPTMARLRAAELIS